MLSLLKAHCIDNQIPIITDESLAFMKDFIQKNNVKSILEIGTAYGYSAVSLASDDVHVDTIEKDLVRANEAKKWIEKYHANVTLYMDDALTKDFGDKVYDLIFIDGAKGQYLKFFLKYKKHLKKGGAIICDNLYFHNLKESDTRVRGTKHLIRKLGLFRSFLETNVEFETTFLEIGDGLSISILKD